MKLRILFGAILIPLAGISIFLGYELQQEKQLRMDLQQAYTQQEQSRHLRAKADSLLDTNAYEDALFYYAQVDSSRGSNLTQQHAAYIINLIQVQNRKADSLFNLNFNLKRELRKEFEKLMQAQGTTDTFRIRLDSMFNELNNLQDQIVEAGVRENSLVDSINTWRTSRQFRQFVVDDSVKIYYLGPVKNEMANGFGYGIIASGGVYEGEWKNNRRHGKGKYTWRNGHVYEGDFTEGRIEGFGTYTFPSGEKYSGNWKANLREGKGTLYNEAGTVVLDGQWVKDKFKGGR
jgi:hypothetical protein